MSGHPWVDNVHPALHGICSEVESEKFMVVYVITLEEHKIVCYFDSGQQKTQNLELYECKRCHQK